MQDKSPTELGKVYRLAEIARENLDFVYEVSVSWGRISCHGGLASFLSIALR